MPVPAPSSHPALSRADNVAMSTGDFVLLCGRILIGWIFVRSGYGKIFDIAGYAASFPRRGIPMWLAWIAVPSEFFGGIAIMFGIATRYVIGVMLTFIVVASFTSHAYWNFTDVAQRRLQDSAFWKNIAIIGGFLFLFVSGPGRWSVDGWLTRRR